MKKYLVLSVLAGVALVGCNKNIGPDVNQGKEAVRTAEVTFSISTKGATKNTTPKSATEAQVNTVDLFVFNADRQLDAYGRWILDDDEDVESGEFVVSGGVATNDVTGVFSNRLSCTTGDGKKVYAILNAEHAVSTLEQIGNEQALQVLVYSLDANRSGAGTAQSPYVLDNFEMVGYAGANFHAGNNDVAINVDAIVARVEIKKITKNFTSAAQQGALTIKRVYMTNVVNQAGFNDYSDGGFSPRYEFNATENQWYNKYGWDNTNPYVATGAWPYPGRIWNDGSPNVDDISEGMSIFLSRTFENGGYSLAEGVTLNADGTAVTGTDSDAAHSLVFYVMPNQVPWGYDDDSDEDTPNVFGPTAGTAFSARHTKLVVEVAYGGATYYYPIPIAKNGTYPMGSDSDDGTGYDGIKSNLSYEIEELELTRLGSRNPDECVLPADVKFSISVNPWTQQLIETETGKYVI